MTADDAAGESNEGILLDEPTTADLRAKVTEAWREFAAALAALVPTLAPGAHIDVTLDPTASGTGMAVYSVSTTKAGKVIVQKDKRITVKHIREMEAAGMKKLSVEPDFMLGRDWGRLRSGWTSGLPSTGVAGPEPDASFCDGSPSGTGSA